MPHSLQPICGGPHENQLLEFDAENEGDTSEKLNRETRRIPPLTEAAFAEPVWRIAVGDFDLIRVGLVAAKDAGHVYIYIKNYND